MTVRFGVLASSEVASRALCAGARARSEYQVGAILPVDASVRSYGRLLESAAIDAIYLGAGVARAFDYALAAVASGVHVLFEDMPTATPDEWDALACVTQMHEPPSLLASGPMVAQANRAASAIARSGRLGVLRWYSAVACTRDGDLPTLVLECVNRARELFDADPIEVLAVDRCENPRVLSVALRFTHDQLAFVSCGFERPTSFRHDIAGTEGDVKVSSTPSSDSDEILANISGVSRRHRVERSSGLESALSQFAHDIRYKPLRHSTPEMARSNARILNAIEQETRSARGFGRGAPTLDVACLGGARLAHSPNGRSWKRTRSCLAAPWDPRASSSDDRSRRRARGGAPLRRPNL
jgi:hypothetical protein